MAGVRRRLDVELVRRNLAPSRQAAQELIAAGLVTVGGQRASKPATLVIDSAAVVVKTKKVPSFASRGGHKLTGALTAFEPAGLSPIEGRKCLDAGASTGGFTDVLLRRGASQVIAVDVGYGQLVWALQQDPRVVVMDRTNIRTLKLDELAFQPDLVVADLSFISLRLVLPALTSVVAGDGDLVLMVKPQFEVGRQRLGKNGVVRDLNDRADAVWSIVETGASLGWGAREVAASPLPGPAGNVEFFLWFRFGPTALEREAVADYVRAATNL